MSILDRLLGRSGGPGSGRRAEPAPRDQHAAYYYLRCDKCGEAIQVRIDRRWDLQQEFEGDGEAVSGYVATKEVMGKRCVKMMRLTVHFDQGHRELAKEIRGASFITRQEFDQAQA